MSRELATKNGPAELKVFFENELAKSVDALPKHIRSDRQIATLLGILARRNDVATCDKISILNSTVQALTLGLDLSENLAEVYLVPRYNSKKGVCECTLVVGYVGLIKLVRQAGQVANIQARIVYRDDEFAYEYTPDLNFMHRPAIGKKRSGGREEVKFVYAIAKLLNGEYLVEVMTVDQVEEVRACSKSANGGPWSSHWQEMAKKSALRRLAKILPKTADLVKALEINDSEFDFDAKPQIDHQTGHGSGKYASPDQTAEYLAKMESYLDERNSRWLDRWSRDGEVPDGVKDLCNRWAADKHLLKWCIDTGRLDPAIDVDGLKNAQIGRYTAIVYHRGKDDRKALTRELSKYIDEIEARQTEAVRAKHPELFETEDFGDEQFEDDPEGVYEAATVEALASLPVSTPAPVAPNSKDKKKDGPKAADTLFKPVPREPGSDD